MKQFLPSRRTVFATAIVVTAGTGLAFNLAAQQDPSGNGEGERRGPTEEMLKVCVSKSAGDSCSATGPQGRQYQGTCFAPQGRPLACRPSQGGRQEGGPGGDARGAGGPPPSESNTGTMLTSTRAFTSGSLCSHAVDKMNPQISLTAKAKWTCANGQRSLVANGIPDHAVGTFPNNANPNKISEQTVKFTVTTSPIAYSGQGGRVKEAVMGLNGIKFDPGTGGSCNDDITASSQCPLGPGGGGRWNIEALGQNVFDFGEDMNNAHVQPGGTYHYHGVPMNMLNVDAKAGRKMQMIGWAADGFPVYARYGYPEKNVMTGGLKQMRPSYRLKASPDSGRPATSIVPMGAFAQDWQYVDGSGDLDQCNGRFGSTPEFPEGIYHYFATDAYPYIQRCVKGSIESQPQMRDRARSRGQGGRRGPPPGGREGGQGGGRN